MTPGWEPGTVVAYLVGLTTIAAVATEIWVMMR